MLFAQRVEEVREREAVRSEAPGLSLCQQAADMIIVQVYVPRRMEVRLVTAAPLLFVSR